MSMTQVEERTALLRILKATRGLAGQATLAAATVGAMALLGGANLPPELAGFVGGVGYNAIYDLLKRLAGGEDVPDVEIEAGVRRALDDVALQEALHIAETQAMIGRLFRRVDLLQYALQDGQADLLQRLTEQARGYDALRAELRNQFSELATCQQTEQIIALLQGLQARLEQGQRPAPPLQLPRRAERFIAREVEIERLLGDLRPGRVVTLCGPGGVGKSALAAEALWRMAGDGQPPAMFPDGVIWHDFYAEKRAAVALEQIARSFGLDPQPSPAAAAQRVLAGRTALLLLDGAEQADDLDAVLAVRGGCGVLITSRLHGHQIDAGWDLHPLTVDAAVALLRQWAGGRVADETASQRICQLVGGLRLAVRLAGSYMASRQEDAADYLAWLEESPLAALDHGQRQRESVPVLLFRSLGVLDDGAQMALGVASVLAPVSFDRAAVAAALDVSAAQAGRWLGTLVDYSLLMRSEQRYQVTHTLIHTYARSRLAMPDDALQRLAAHFTTLAEAQCQQGPAGYRRLDLERPHLLALLGACRSAAAWQAIDALVRAMHGYLEIQGYWTEHIVALETGLAAAQAMENREDEGAYVSEIGSVLSRRGVTQRAIEYYKQALAISQEVGDLSGEVTNLCNLGIVHLALGDARRAMEYFEETLAIEQGIDRPRDAVAILSNLGSAWLALGDASEAIEYYEQVLEISRKIGDRRGEGVALGNLGAAHDALGNTQQSIEDLEHALAISQEIGDRWLESDALSNLGYVYWHLGDFQRSSEYAHQSLAISRQTGNRWSEVAGLGSLGNVHGSQGDVQRSIQLYEQALLISQEIGDRRSESSSLGSLGNEYYRSGDAHRAIEYHEIGLAISREIGDRQGEGTHLANLGRMYRDLGDIPQTIEHYQQALVVFQTIESPHVATVHNWLAQLDD